MSETASQHIILSFLSVFRWKILQSDANQSINQVINQTINSLAINQSINQSINHSLYLCILQRDGYFFPLFSLPLPDFHYILIASGTWKETPRAFHISDQNHSLMFPHQSRPPRRIHRHTPADHVRRRRAGRVLWAQQTLLPITTRHSDAVAQESRITQEKLHKHIICPMIFIRIADGVHGALPAVRLRFRADSGRHGGQLIFNVNNSGLGRGGFHLGHGFGEMGRDGRGRRIGSDPAYAGEQSSEVGALLFGGKSGGHRSDSRVSHKIHNRRILKKWGKN